MRAVVVLPTPRAPEKIYPCATRSGEDGVFQGVGDQPLAHHLIKDLGPILAGYDLVGHGTKLDIGF